MLASSSVVSAGRSEPVPVLLPVAEPVVVEVGIVLPALDVEPELGAPVLLVVSLLLSALASELGSSLVPHDNKTPEARTINFRDMCICRNNSLAGGRIVAHSATWRKLQSLRNRLLWFRATFSRYV